MGCEESKRRLVLRIAILTSGGDAPGMNAAVRAVARTAFCRGWEVIGVWAEHRGLLEGRIYPMDRRRLGGNIHRGGTVLGTAAVEALADGETGVMVGIRGPRIERVPLEEVVGKEQPLDPDLYRMAEVLAELPE